MEIKSRFDHFNINVLDLDRSIAFYGKALGLKEHHRKEAADGSFILVYLTDNETGFLLELTWLHDRKEGDYRYVTPTFSPLLVLQLRGSGHRRRKLGDVQDVEGERRFTYEINEQRKLLPRQDAGSRFRYQADSIRYLCRYVVRR